MRRYFLCILFTAVLTIICFSVYGKKTDDNLPAICNCPELSEVEHQLGICKTGGLALNAKTALVVDNSTGVWLYNKRAMRIRPIASLTKLLGAMVYLDTDPNLDTVVYISNRDCYNSAKSNLRRGEAYLARDLLYVALMASDNRAARAMATASGLPREIFIQRMNDKARMLGMMNTQVFEVTGLDEHNVSTAAEIAILINESMKYKLIREITSVYTYRAKVQNKNRNKNLLNTNRLIRSRWKVLAGKTGFTLKSDYCLATLLRDKQGKEITVIVLGSPTNNIRFNVARKLAFYGFKRAGRIDDGKKQIASR